MPKNTNPENGRSGNMLRIETESRQKAREVWSYLDAAGFKVKLLVKRSVYAQTSRDEAFRALPYALRCGAIFTQLETEEDER